MINMILHLAIIQYDICNNEHLESSAKFVKKFMQKIMDLSGRITEQTQTTQSQQKLCVTRIVGTRIGSKPSCETISLGCKTTTHWDSLVETFKTACTICKKCGLSSLLDNLTLLLQEFICTNSTIQVTSERLNVNFENIHGHGKILISRTLENC